MGRLLNMAVSAALMLMPALAGCGGSSSTSQSTSTPAGTSQTTSTATGTQTSSSTPNDKQARKTAEASKEHTPQITLALSSPVFSEGSKIPVRYTCDGAGTSPPLRWGAIPRGTVELALFVLNLKGPPGGKLPIYWAVAGLQPTLKGISAGKLPPGAIVGRNSLGQNRYTICPSKRGGLQHYAVALLAVQHPVSATPGFNAGALFETVYHTVEYAGLAGFSYQRR